MLILAGWVLLFFGIGCLGKPQGPCMLVANTSEQDTSAVALYAANT